MLYQRNDVTVLNVANKIRLRAQNECIKMEERITEQHQQFSMFSWYHENSALNTLNSINKQSNIVNIVMRKNVIYIEKSNVEGNKAVRMIV